MSEKIEDKIRRFSAEEMLNDYYNFHLKQILSSWINIQIFSKMCEKDPNQKVGERVGPALKEGQLPTRIEIRAKDALEQEENKFNNQSHTLIAIQKRSEQLSNIKEDKGIWQK